VVIEHHFIFAWEKRHDDLVFRDAAEIGSRTRQSQLGFSEAQAKIRDALDAIFAFFGRLESAIAIRFIDEAPAIGYFGYWLHRLYTVKEYLRRHGHLFGGPVGEIPALCTLFACYPANPEAIVGSASPDELFCLKIRRSPGLFGASMALLHCC
jgi:hypothetical protein